MLWRISVFLALQLGGGLLGWFLGGVLGAALGVIGGGVAWFGVARPHEHIDDISVPLDGPGHDTHPEPEDDHSPEYAHTEESHVQVIHH